jgi:transcriptional regulator
MDNMIEKLIKILLKLSEDGWHLCKDNEILKTTMENISMAEQSSVS